MSPLRSTKALAPLLGASLLSCAVTASPALADAPAQAGVSFGNITAGQTLTGDTQVTLNVQNSATDPVTFIQLTAGQFIGTTPSVRLRQQIPLPADCATSCTVTADLNTTAPVQGGSGPLALPALDDGGVVLVALAFAGTVGVAHADLNALVNNHRPTTVVPVTNTPWSPSTPVGLVGDSSLTVQATAAPGAGAPDGTTVSSVQILVPGQPSWPTLQLTPSADGTSWSTTADTQAIPSGAYPAEAVAVDSNGTVGDPVPLTLVIDHAPTLNLYSGTIAPDALANMGVSYAYGSSTLGCGSGAQYVAPQQISVSVDGFLWNSAPATATGLPQSCFLKVGGTGTIARQLPYGQHRLTVTLTDNRGHTSTATSAITVALPLNVQWAGVKSPLVVGLGTDVNLRAVVTAPDGYSKLADWLIVDRSRAGSSSVSGTYPSTPSWPGWYSMITGTNEVDVAVESDNGLSSDGVLDIDVVPTTATALGLSTTRARRNTVVTFSGHLDQCTSLSTSARPALRNAWALLQFRPAGSSTWTTKAEAVTNVYGNVFFHEKATATGAWRITTATTTGWTGSTSTTTTLTVTP